MTLSSNLVTLECVALPLPKQDIAKLLQLIGQVADKNKRFKSGAHGEMNDWFEKTWWLDQSGICSNGMFEELSVAVLSPFWWMLYNFSVIIFQNSKSLND